MNSFFAHNTFVVNQKVLTIANTYSVQDQDGNKIGAIKEDLKLSRMVLGKILSKKMMPFSLNILDSSDNVIASVHKDFAVLSPTITLQDSNGKTLAVIKKRFNLLKHEYEILDPKDNHLASITGNYIEWSFKVKDNSGTELGSISKKFGGMLKELFTDADKYIVKINPELQDEILRMIVVISAAVVDKIYYEKKD